MKKVAFFDIDGTVFRSSLLIELVEAGIRAEIFPASIRDVYSDSERAWRNRERSYEEYINNVVEAFVLHLKGVHYGAFADLGRQVALEQGKYVYRYTRDLIRDLRAKDYFLVAVSQSPKTILDEFCAALGFHKVYGRIYELGPQDRFTGVVTDVELIQDKSRIVERVFEKEGFSREGSIGVGDTDGDIPLLQSVEMPICFNPNRLLYEHARAHNWPIVVERKDMVYTL
jgi:HAD superfamily phosphoserine phosphatase-like hydrolase